MSDGVVDRPTDGRRAAGQPLGPSPASAIAHRWHPVAAPVSDDNIRRLIAGLGLAPGGRLLDLGCGFGEWLLAGLVAAPGTTANGVDTSEPALAEARAGRRLAVWSTA